jgi:glycosyltransferase involved in cell wall biosynthesis
MHVAVDAANLPRDHRGIGRYARAMLVRWLDMRDRLQVTLLVPDLFLATARRRLATTLGVDDVEVRRRQDVARMRPDLVWYPWNGMTWIAPCASVATVHDVWPFVSPAADDRIRLREQGPYRATASHARAIIANSRFTKSELIKHLPVDPGRVHVISMGADPLPSPAPPAPSLVGAQRYVLFVGESEPRKDPGTLRAAMTKLPAGLRAITGLVMAGKVPGETSTCGSIESGSGNTPDRLLVRFANHNGVPTVVAGEVSDTVLARLYAGAAAFAFPSRYEGFGIPVLEAMAHGVPVVASDAASIPEVGGDAALYFPAGDADALAATLARVLGDPDLARQMGAAGIARAALLSWDRCSRETLGVFEGVIGATPA